MFKQKSTTRPSRPAHHQRLTRRHPGDSTAHYAAHGLRTLNRISLQYAQRAVAGAGTIADIQTMAQFNDLTKISLVAYQGKTALATWILRVNEERYEIQRPVPMPSDFVLRTLRFGLTVTRRDRDHLYKHLLRGNWTRSDIEADHQFTGVVRTLPQPGGRRGEIVSGPHVSVLRHNEADGLQVGDRVHYSVARDNRGRSIAHSVTKITTARAA